MTGGPGNMKNQLDVGILVSPLNDPSIREMPLLYEPLLVYSSHTYEKNYLLPEDMQPEELLLLEEGHGRYAGRIQQSDGYGTFEYLERNFKPWSRRPSHHF